MANVSMQRKQALRHPTRDSFVTRPTDQPLLYTLAPNGEPVVCLEHKRWQDWINVTTNRVLARTDISDRLYVETWFVGVDQRPAGQPGPPLLFLTEIFEDGKKVEGYRTWHIKRAAMAHDNVVTRLAATMERMGA